MVIKLLLEGSAFHQRCSINAGLLTIDGLFFKKKKILASLILRKSRPLNKNFLKNLEIVVSQ